MSAFVNDICFTIDHIGQRAMDLGEEVGKRGGTMKGIASIHKTKIVSCGHLYPLVHRIIDPVIWLANQ